MLLVCRERRRKVRFGPEVFVFHNGEPVDVPDEVASALLADESNRFVEYGKEFPESNIKRPAPYRMAGCRVGGIGDGLIAAGEVSLVKKRFPYSEFTGYTMSGIDVVWETLPQFSRVIQHNMRAKRYPLWFDFKPCVEIGCNTDDAALRAFYDRAVHHQRRFMPNEERRNRLARMYEALMFESCRMGLTDTPINASLMGLRVTSEAKARVQQLLADRLTGKPYVTVHDWSFGGRQLKCWPLAYWGALIEWLQQAGFTVFQIGGAGAERAIGKMEGAVNLCGVLTFEESCALMQGAVMHIDNESTPAHAAAALGVPCMVFAGVTNCASPEGPSYWGHHENHNVLRSDGGCIRCEGCNPNWTNRCEVTGESAGQCMMAVTPEVATEEFQYVYNNRAAFRSGEARFHQVAVGLAVVHYERKDLTEITLSSIEKNETYLNLDKMVVVNDGDEEYAAVLKERGYRVIVNPRRTPLAKAWNDAVKALPQMWICLMNNDVEVSGEWLQMLLDYRHIDKAAVGVTGHKLSPQFTHAGEVLDRKEWFHYVGGYCFLVNRDAWLEVGGFDERFPLWSEDADFCMSARKKGYDLAIVPEAMRFIKHLGGATADAHPETNKWKEASLKLMREKHGSVV